MKTDENIERERLAMLPSLLPDLTRLADDGCPHHVPLSCDCCRADCEHCTCWHRAVLAEFHSERLGFRTFIAGEYVSEGAWVVLGSDGRVYRARRQEDA